jgi:hypothetical protein
LIEKGRHVGGTVARALIHTLAGLYDSAGEFLNGGLARELAERLMAADRSVRQRRMGRTCVLNVCPTRYRNVAQQWLGEERRIKLLCNTQVTRVIVSGDRVVEIEVAGPHQVSRICPRAIVDATGGGEVVRQLDPSLLHDDSRSAAGGLIFCMRGVRSDALTFPNGLAVLRALHAAAEQNRLPHTCRHAWIDTGLHDDEVYVKLFVPLLSSARDSHDRISRSARRVQARVVSFLKGLPEFARARVTRTGQLGVRDGGRIRGEYQLSVSDVRQGRRFSDAACRCSWPIEYWDPSNGLSLEYLAPCSYYEIPMASLRVKGWRGLWAAGKCLSADPLAHASARVVGTCWAMGEAVGKAAAIDESRP